MSGSCIAQRSAPGTTSYAATLITLRETACAPALIAKDTIQVIAKTGDWLTVLCMQVSPRTLDALVLLPASQGATRLAVFCPRPKALAALLAARGVEANTYSIADALLRGQAGNKASSRLPATGALGATS